MSEFPAPPPAETEEAKPSPPRAPWTVADSLYVLLLWVLAIYVIGGLIFALLQSVLDQSQAEALTLPLTALMLIGITTGFVRLRYPGATPLLFGSRRPSWRAAGYGVAAGLVAVGVIGFGLGALLEVLARTIGERLPEVQEEFRALAADRQTAPLLVFGSVLVAPVAEELFYRGMFFPALRKRMAVWPAAGVSGLLFGVSHLQTTLDGYLLVLLIVMPLGIVLAWLYERTGTLLVPVLAHATFNLVQVIVLILQES